MSDSDPLFIAVLAFFVGLWMFYTGFKEFNKKRFIENLPTSKVRSIAMGLVELYGKAVPVKDKVTKSPFSGIDCVYYRYVVEELRRKGKRSRWVKVKEGSKVLPFYLEDDTGKVLVDARAASVDLLKHNTCKSGWGYDPPENVKAFLSKQNINHESLLGINKTLRYHEYFISPGQDLYVLGTAGDNPYVEEGSVESGFEDIMIQKGKDRYYITDRSEEKILCDLGNSCLVGVFLGPLISIGGLAYLLIRFNML